MMLLIVVFGFSADQTVTAQFSPIEGDRGGVGAAVVGAANLLAGGDGSTTLVVRNSHRTTATVCVLPQDELWLVSARNCEYSPHDLAPMTVDRFCSGRWEPDHLQNLVSSHSQDKSKATLMYIHGNLTDESWAASRGLQFYDNLFADNSECRPPVRFIILAWRSERELFRLSRDYVAKSKRAASIGCTLSQLLNQFDDRHMVLTGFSLGVQVTVAALNHPELQWIDENDGKGKYHVSLIAPAFDGDYVCSILNCQPNANAVQRTEVFVNPIDRALRVSRFVRRRQCPGGDTRIATLHARGNLPLANVNFNNLANQLGKTHSVVQYSSSNPIRASLNLMLKEVYEESQSLHLNSPVSTSNSDDESADPAIQVVETVVEKVESQLGSAVEPGTDVTTEESPALQFEPTALSQSLLQ